MSECMNEYGVGVRKKKWLQSQHSSKVTVTFNLKLPVARLIWQKSGQRSLSKLIHLFDTLTYFSKQMRENGQDKVWVKKKTETEGLASFSSIYTFWSLFAVFSIRISHSSRISLVVIFQKFISCLAPVPCSPKQISSPSADFRNNQEWIPGGHRQARKSSQ